MTKSIETKFNEVFGKATGTDWESVCCGGRAHWVIEGEPGNSNLRCRECGEKCEIRAIKWEYDKPTLEDVMRKLFSLADGWRYDFDCNGIHRQHETSGKAFICQWNLNGQQTEESMQKLISLIEEK